MYVENEVRLGGNLTREPELRQAGESVVADFGLAINRKAANGKDEVLFVDVNCWGKCAEACAKYLRKGSNVAVKGRLVMDQWIGKDGAPKNKMKVTATEVQFVSNPKGSQEGDAGDGNYRPQPYQSRKPSPAPQRSRGVSEDYAPPLRDDTPPDDYGEELPPF